MATIYEIQTERAVNKILEAQKEGKSFHWSEPWSGGCRVAMSYTTQKPYRGINSITLPIGEYITYKALCELQRKVGSKVFISIKKGAKMYPIFYSSKMLVNNGKNFYATTKDLESIWFTRYYNAFHIKDIEGIESKFPVEHYTHTPLQNSELMETYIKAFYSGVESPKISYKEAIGRAYYSPLEHAVTVPKKDNFKSLYSYYETVLHETIHSTGKELKRDIKNHKGDKDYSYEELVAEIGASVTLTMFGIVDDIQEQNIAYILGWASRLQENNKMIIKAANDASKAVKYFIETAEKLGNFPEKISKIIGGEN